MSNFNCLLFLVTFAAAIFCKVEFIQVIAVFMAVYMFIDFLQRAEDDTNDILVFEPEEQEFPITEFNTTMGPAFPEAPSDGDIHFLDVVRDGVEDVEVWRYDGNAWNHLQ